ncbi:hypothetical protein [Gynuella sunshinyii]|uniref:Right handed beta helix domain-containing protein n=1 Tax=Gynuella sunshinyii YC6258 TaxID=1445510 RepID=A0A0C5VRT9_9GAMM|nr:hypothetical protein [Gynuella sunshinyii]AJQ97347.1 hypothetical Protein YC6258_05317 [Gynuella sunshinyii YC6258]
MKFFIAFLILISSGPALAEIAGAIDTVKLINNNSQVFIHGWACQKGRTDSIDVHLYSGAPAGSSDATIIRGAKANIKAADAGDINKVCKAYSEYRRFSLVLTESQWREHGGRKLYVHGIDSNGPNTTITNSGSFTIPERKVIGHIDPVHFDTNHNNFIVSGWACLTYSSEQPMVELGIGSKTIRSVVASRNSEDAVARACNTPSGSAHRFSFELPRYYMHDYQYQNIEVRGSLSGARATLNNSYRWQVPFMGDIPPLSDPESSYDSLPAGCPVGENVTSLSTDKLYCRMSSGQSINTQVKLSGRLFSNLVLDCNNGTLTKQLVIESYKQSENVYSVPENIVIKNCTIPSIRIIGMGKNGQSKDVVESSRLGVEHVKRVRDSAPHGIVFDNITIAANEETPFYIGPGVHYVTMQNSHFTGKSKNVVLYLDVDSYRNSFLNNIFETDTTNIVEIANTVKVYDKSRELVAIDGSSFNIFRGNYFAYLEAGGIYLYRNCGEGGAVRYSSPSFNLIENNRFYYNHYDGDKPGIFIGSRQGPTLLVLDCSADNVGNPPLAGSVTSNRDQAMYNVVRNNKFKKEVRIINNDNNNQTYGNTLY